MSESERKPADEAQRVINALRAQARDLAGLLWVGARWRGRTEDQIVRELPDALCTLLHLDAAYVRAERDGAQLVSCRPPGDQDALHEALRAVVAVDGSAVDLAGGRARLLRVVDESVGILLTAASMRPDFPSEEERFLLHAALTQVVSAVKTARLIAHIEQADRRKDDFLAMLAHELRNPLGTMSLGLQLMRFAPDDPNERRRAMVQKHLSHLTRLIDDLMDVSRIVRGKIQLQKQVVQLQAVISNAVEMVAPLLEQRGQHLELEVEDGLVLEGDPVRLTQVVTNLLTNAAKYTEKPSQITLSAARVGPQVVLRVRDRGIGIPADLMPGLFEPFVQGDRTLDRSQGGLGLGLSLVRGVVTLHGGTVTAHSDGAGMGSEFVVRLPALDAKAAGPTSSQRTSSADEKAPGKVVLVVEDNLDAANLVAEALAAQRFTVRVAHDGLSAVEVGERIDAAIVDIGLPLLDGFEVGRRLRGRYPAATLIAVSGYGQPSDVQRSRDCGFDSHLLKPIDIGALLAALSRV